MSYKLSIDENKVIDKVIDVYLWIMPDLNTEEVKMVGQKLIDLADYRATDVELVYQANICSIEPSPTSDEDLPF